MQTCERVLESNTFLSSSITLLCVLALVLSNAPSAIGQSSSATGRIDGTVLDSSGAAVPSAEIMHFPGSVCHRDMYPFGLSK